MGQDSTIRVEVRHGRGSNRWQRQVQNPAFDMPAIIVTVRIESAGTGWGWMTETRDRIGENDWRAMLYMYRWSGRNEKAQTQRAERSEKFTKAKLQPSGSGQDRIRIASEISSWLDVNYSSFRKGRWRHRMVYWIGTYASR